MECTVTLYSTLENALHYCLQLNIPVSERRASTEENSFGLGLRLVKQTEERVVLHTVLPEDLTLVSTGHHKLKCILMGALKKEKEKSFS